MIQAMKIRKITGHIGAEITGVDLAGDLDAATIKAIGDALDEHVAIYFRDQHLTPADIERYVGWFGERLIHPYMQAVKGATYVHQIRKLPDETLNFGGTWHADFTNLTTPGATNSLYSLEVPDFGGETVICNSTAAYEALSLGMKRMLENMNAWHGYSPEYKALYAIRKTELKDQLQSAEDLDVDGEDVLHPVIRSHPNTGRKSLFINPLFTLRFEDMSRAESLPLLNQLYDHITRPEFCVRFGWEKNMLASWDNRQSMHYAVNDYPGQRRVMNRCLTIDTARPVGTAIGEIGSIPAVGLQGLEPGDIVDIHPRMGSKLS